MQKLQHNGLDIIEDTVGHGSQSWTRKVTARWAGHKIRATIERDSYDRQSRIYVEVFAPAALQWNRLQTLEGTDHKDLHNAYSKDDEAIREDSQYLADGLLGYAQQILEDVPAATPAPTPTPFERALQSRLEALAEGGHTEWVVIGSDGAGVSALRNARTGEVRSR